MLIEVRKTARGWIPRLSQVHPQKRAGARQPGQEQYKHGVTTRRLALGKSIVCGNTQVTRRAQRGRRSAPSGPPWSPSAPNARRPSTARSARCPVSSYAPCRPDGGPTRCTGCRSGSPRTRPWSGSPSAAGPRGAARPARRAGRRARLGDASRGGSRRRRSRPPPPGSRTGRRCTVTGGGSAWCTRSRRRARRPVRRLAARPGGRAARQGRLLSAGGLLAATAGAYLGGHLALRLGAGVSHAEPISHLAALGWHDLCPLAELPGRRGPAPAQLPERARRARRRRGAGARGPLLAPGRAAAPGAGGQRSGVPWVTCPWHGSAFRLSDGAVRHGPATARQPAFDARVTGAGMVQVRPQDPPGARGASRRPGSAAPVRMTS